MSAPDPTPCLPASPAQASAAAPPGWPRWPWPGTLQGRVALILLTGLALAWGLAQWQAQRARDRLMDGLMQGWVARDVAGAVALLDHLSASERAAWLPRLARPNYGYALAEGSAASVCAGPADGRPATSLGRALAADLGPARLCADDAGPSAPRYTLRLSDGQAVQVQVQALPRGLPVEAWLTALAQLALVGGAVLLAARVALRPLQQLAQAALQLGDAPESAPTLARLAGPREVRQAAEALDRMRQRIVDQASEQLQILAAIAHDLRTPITRLRLRCEQVPASAALRERLQADLDEMAHLVDDGLALAASAHARDEPPCPVDLAELLDALACDYADAGQPLQWDGALPCVAHTRPRALRRAIGNLLDNALTFGAGAPVQLQLQPAGDPGGPVITVADRGPGIPPERVAEALAPFRRLEPSRNRGSGGSGLGLAIAQRLATALEARLTLAPRPGGGLEARLQLPRG